MGCEDFSKTNTNHLYAARYFSLVPSLSAVYFLYIWVFVSFITILAVVNHEKSNLCESVPVSARVSEYDATEVSAGRKC